VKRGPGVLALPFLGGVVVLVGVPALAALALAFTEFSGVQPPRFNGFANITRLFGDEAFWRALGNTMIYVAVSVPLRVGLAVGCALLLARRTRGARVARAAVYLPTVVPDVAYALLWLWLLNPLFGPLALLGAGDALVEPWGARLALPVMAAFQIGEAFVVALAARRTVPGALYEAASLEGASPWYVTRRLTLPLMAPVIGLLLLRDVVVALHTNFLPALILTDGGPRFSTTYLSLYVYRTAFRYFRLGYASTIALAIFLLTALALYAQYRIVKRWRAA
jgi:multiple sugar transport system permease protein